MTLFYTKNSISDFYSPTLFIIEPKENRHLKKGVFFDSYIYFLFFDVIMYIG